MVASRLAPSTLGLRVGEVRPVTAEQAAREARVPLRTWQRWLVRWHQLGVTGVETAKSRAHAGRRWSLAPDLVARWRRGELPSPYARQRAAA